MPEHRIKSWAVRKNGGFTLIEAAVFLFLFSVVTMTFYQLYGLGSRHMFDAKRKLGATALANQRMEIIRSLEYDDVGTKRPDGSGGWDYGIPAGDILEEETVESSGGIYVVHTFVQFIDDPYDAEFDGGDFIPTDYKRARVRVSWGEDVTDSHRFVSVFGTFAKNGLEQMTDTGILSLNVIDSAGMSVPQAEVRIVNAAADVDFSYTTGNDGNLSLPGAPPGEFAYEIAVTKGGYYGAHTYPMLGSLSFDPVDKHASVAVDSVNPVSIVMDRESDITVVSRDPFGETIPDVAFHLEGGRIIAMDRTGSTPVPIYGVDRDIATGSDGEYGMSDESPGRYFVNLDVTESGYEILYRHADADPVAGREAFDVVAGTEHDASVVLMDRSLDSLLVTVNDDAMSSVRLPGATVRIVNPVIGFDQTVTTDVRGQAFFPSESSELPDGTYSYEIDASGFVTKTGTFEFGGSGLEKKTVGLVSE